MVAIMTVVGWYYAVTSRRDRAYGR